MNESEANGDPIIMVGAIAGGTAESPINTVQELEGRATYEGSATGVYVKRRVTPDGAVDNRRGGQFTADATLTATFGGGSVPANDHYSIMGSIDNFREQKRQIHRLQLESRPGGSVVRQSTKRCSHRHERQRVQRRDRGRSRLDGRLERPLLRTRRRRQRCRDAGNQPTFPSGVAGTFSGHFTNGDVLGAFGAEIVN